MSKIINPDELSRYPLRPTGKRHKIWQEIDFLKINQTLVVEPHDFTWKKCSPYVFIKRIEKSSAKRFKLMKGKHNRQWLLTRVEDAGG